MNDIELYHKNPYTGELSFREVVRPEILVNDLGPIVVGDAVRVKALRNEETLLDLQYTMSKEVVAGRKVLAVLSAKFSERALPKVEEIPAEPIKEEEPKGGATATAVESISDNFIKSIKTETMETIECHDVEIYAKIPITSEMVYRQAERPRNIVREIGPYIEGDSFHIDFTVNDKTTPFDYKIDAIAVEGFGLYASLIIDFVEMN